MYACTQELAEKIREKIIERRTVVHKANEAEITARWTFEEAVSIIMEYYIHFDSKIYKCNSLNLFFSYCADKKTILPREAFGERSTKNVEGIPRV